MALAFWSDKKIVLKVSGKSQHNSGISDIFITGSNGLVCSNTLISDNSINSTTGVDKSTETYVPGNQSVSSVSFYASVEDPTQTSATGNINIKIKWRGADYIANTEDDGWTDEHTVSNVTIMNAVGDVKFSASNDLWINGASISENTIYLTVTLVDKDKLSNSNTNNYIYYTSSEGDSFNVYQEPNPVLMSITNNNNNIVIAKKSANATSITLLFNKTANILETGYIDYSVTGSYPEGTISNEVKANKGSFTGKLKNPISSIVFTNSEYTMNALTTYDSEYKINTMWGGRPYSYENVLSGSGSELVTETKKPETNNGTGTYLFIPSLAGTYGLTVSSTTNSSPEIVSGSTTIYVTKVTPTYTEPTVKDLTYTGSQLELLNAGKTNDGTIQYSTDNEHWSTDIPKKTAAGSYTIYWRLVGDANHNDVPSTPLICGINKASSSYVAPTLKDNLSYNGNLQTIINPGTTSDGIIYYSADGVNWYTDVNNSNVLVKNAGEITRYWKIEGDSNHNGVDKQTLTTTVSRINPTYSAPTAKDLVYSGSAQALVNAGTTTTPGTFTYKLNGTADTAYSTTIPTAIHRADTLTVNWKFTPTDTTNYNVITGNVTATMAKANPTYTAPTDANPTYTGSLLTVINAGVTSHGKFLYSKDGNTWYDAVNNTNVLETNASTSITRYWKLVGDNDHNDVTSTQLVCSMNKANPIYTAPTKKSLTYTGNALNLVNAGTSTTPGTFTYKLSTGATYLSTIPTATNCDDTLIVDWKFTPDDTTNYNIKTGTITSTMDRAQATITAPTAKTLTYTGNALNLVNAGTSTTPGTFKYKLSTESVYSTAIPTATHRSDTLTVDWTFTPTSTVNFNGASGTVTATMNKANPTYTAPTDVSPTYNGSALTIIKAGSTSHGTIYYSHNNSTWYTSVSETNLKSTTASNTITRYWKLVGDNDHNDVASTSFTCSIKKATPTLDLAGVNVMYDGTKHYATTLPNTPGTLYWSKTSGFTTANGTAIVITDTSKATQITSITDDDSDKDPDFVVYVMFYPTDTTNYNNITTQLTINMNIYDAPVTKPTGNNTKPNYDGNRHSVTFTGGVGGSITNYRYSTDEKNWTTSSTNPTFIDAGTKYYVQCYYLGDGNHNASGWSTSGTIEIQRIAPTITITDKNSVYASGADYATVSITSGGGKLWYAVTNSATAPTSGWTETLPTVGTSFNVGSTIYIHVKSDLSTNYTAYGPVSKAVTLRKATPTYTAPTKKSLSYTGSAQALVNAGSVPTGGTAGTFTYKHSKDASYSSTLPTATNCTDDLIVDWKFTPNDTTNYNIATGLFTSTMAKVDPVYTAPTNAGPIYNGSPLTIITPGSTLHGKIQYSHNGSTWYDDYDNANLKSTEVSNSITRYWRLVGDSNHNDVTSTAFTCTIKNGIVSITEPKGNTLTYTGSAQALVSGAANVTPGTFYYKLDGAADSAYSTTIPTATNCTDNLKVNWKFLPTDTSSYLPKTGTVTATMNKAVPTYTEPTAVTGLVYSGSALTIIKAGTTSDGTLKYSHDGTTWYTSVTETNLKSTNASTSIIRYWKLDGDDNHTNVNSTLLTCSIAKADPTIVEPSKKALTYNKSALAIVNAGTNTTAGTFTYKLKSLADSAYSTTIPTATNCSDELIVDWKFTPTSTTNFNSKSGLITSTMDRAELNLAITPTGNPYELTYLESQLLTLTGNSGSGNVSWSSTVSDYVSIDAGLIKALLVGKDSVITASVAETTNYKTGSATLTVRPIKKADTPTVTTSLAKDVTWSKTNTDISFTAATANTAITYELKSVTNKNNADCKSYFTLASGKLTANFTTYFNELNPVNSTYTITLTASSAGNTNYSPASKDFTILLTINKTVNNVLTLVMVDMVWGHTDMDPVVTSDVGYNLAWYAKGTNNTYTALSGKPSYMAAENQDKEFKVVANPTTNDYYSAGTSKEATFKISTPFLELNTNKLNFSKLG